jgi:hypothetical protein
VAAGGWGGWGECAAAALVCLASYLVEVEIKVAGKVIFHSPR